MEFFHARILQWVPIPSPGDRPNPGIEPGYPTLQADSLLSEPPGKAYHHTKFVVNLLWPSSCVACNQNPVPSLKTKDLPCTLSSHFHLYFLILHQQVAVMAH